MRILAAIALLFWMSLSVAVAADPTPPPDTRVEVPAPSEKALEYFRGNTAIWCVRIALAIAIPATILFTGLSARIRDLAVRWGRKAFFTAAIYYAVYAVLVFLITLPLDFYTGFVRQHAYELSNQTFGKWAWDQSIGLAVDVVIGGSLLWLPYLLIRRSRRYWWLWTAVAAIPITCGLIVLSPIVIDPLFNDFGPMKDKALEAKILSLAERAGIEGSRVYEVAKSEDTKAVNAYVTGFGGSKRIVLWDTTLAKLDERQILFVMGHEMGHYVLGHIRNTIVILAFGILGILFAADRISRWFLSRFASRFRFSALGDVASLPLILLIAAILNLVVSPAALAYSRWQEHEADRFGLEITHDNWAGASAFVRLQQENLGVPRPGRFYEIFRASHPTLGARVDFCNDYRPWESGAPERYSSRFRKTP